MTVRIIQGDCRDVLRSLDTGSVQTCVTSPPYFKQRIYGIEDEIGHEASPIAFAEALMPIFAEVNRVLADDGTLWLQIGDTYAAGGNGASGSLAAKRRHWEVASQRKGWRRQPDGFKEKDITLTPFVVADMLRAEGWYLRSTIIWNKVIATEPPRLDRPATAHEYLFLLSKSQHYAVRDPGEKWFQSTVWDIRPQPSYTGHPAVMPAELARRCIICSTRAGGMVLDPFCGAGTTLMAADRLGRQSIGIEANPEFFKISKQRLFADGGMFTEMVAE